MECQVDRLRRNFWSSHTLSHLVATQVEHLAASARNRTLSRWKLLVVLPTLNSSLAAWYRCKLGLASAETNGSNVQPHVKVNFTLVSETKIEEEVIAVPLRIAHFKLIIPLHQDLEDVGLVIVNIESSRQAQSARRTLDKTLKETCRYKVPLIQANWTKRSDPISDAFVQHSVNTDQMNGGLGDLLRNLLVSIRPSSLVFVKISSRGRPIPKIRYIYSAETRQNRSYQALSGSMAKRIAALAEPGSKSR